jgi:thioredoxin-related protein
MRIFLALAVLLSLNAFSADSTKLYNPNANVEKDVAEAVAKAKKLKKHVMIQVGGNWCSWCYKLNAFLMTDSTLKNLLEANYVVYHLNYSPENKNLAYLKKAGYPQRFGFPALLILDANGKQLHTQDSALLEKGNGYDYEKVKFFLQNWSPAAFNEALYTK